MDDIKVGMDVLFIDPDINIQRGIVRSIVKEEPEESHFDCIFMISSRGNPRPRAREESV